MNERQEIEEIVDGLLGEELLGEMAMSNVAVVHKAAQRTAEEYADSEGWFTLADIVIAAGEMKLRRRPKGRTNRDYFSPAEMIGWHVFDDMEGGILPAMQTLVQRGLYQMKKGVHGLWKFRLV